MSHLFCVFMLLECGAFSLHLCMGPPQSPRCDEKKSRLSGFSKGARRLLDVLADQASQFEHRHLGLAKQWLELASALMLRLFWHMQVVALM